MTENYDNNNSNKAQSEEIRRSSWADGNCGMIKLLSVALSSFLGAFLAIVLLGKIFVNNDIPPQSQSFTPHQMQHKADINDTLFVEDEWLKEINRDFELMSPKMVMPIATHKLNIVKFEENDDNYKLTINLKQFHDNEKNIIVDVKPHSVKISGKASSKNEKEQSSFSYTQEIPLYKKADIDDVKKEKINNDYVVTIPFED